MHGGIPDADAFIVGRLSELLPLCIVERAEDEPADDPRGYGDVN